MNSTTAYIGPVDIARATGVTDRTVRNMLAKEFPRDQVKIWRFASHELPQLVEMVQRRRKRHRKNVYNTPGTLH